MLLYLTLLTNRRGIKGIIETKEGYQSIRSKNKGELDVILT